MAWNGSGIFSRIYNWVAERDAGNNIDATKFDAENDNFATGIQACLTKNGENAPTSDLPMAGNKHTGVGDGSARAHYAALGQVQDSSVLWGGTTGGAANVQTMTLTPAITAYAAGQTFSFIAGFTNTAACTLNVNSVGAKNIYSAGAACVGGEITAGQVYAATYDGTQFNLIGANDGGADPACRLTKSGAQTIATGSTTAITWQTEDYDYGSIHSASSANIVPTVDGVYSVSASVQFTQSGVGSRWVGIYKNGVAGTLQSIALAEMAGLDNGYCTLCVSGDVDIDAGSGDYITIGAYQNTGGNLDILTTNSHVSCHLARRT